MNDITIIDLFWLILKFLAALGLVGLISVALFLLWIAAKRAAKTTWDILRGRNRSVAAITCFSIAVVILVSGIILAAGYLNDHPNLLH
jgi:uncharacterized membrane protein YidH (DUF202 family)